MALAPRDFPLTRDEVAGWLVSYGADLNPTDPLLRGYLVKKVGAKKFVDSDVNTESYDNLGEVTSIVDMILMDLRSYA